MSPKKRVYDLAKLYGMSGQDLAAKLRDLGFADVKSHMTALDEFKVLEIQARLEAYGIVGESVATEEASLGGLKLKRKKKKKPVVAEEPPAPPDEEPPAAAEEPEPEPEPESEPEPEAAERIEEVGEAPEEAPESSAEAEPAAVAEAAAPAEVGAQAEVEEPTEIEAQAEVETPVEVDAPTEADETPAPETTDAQPEAPPADAGAPSEPAAEAAAENGDKKAGGDVVRPGSKRRTGKVVGFIDPAQFAQKQKAKPQSRRLASRDDVVPDVMPTFGHDRARGFVRGDTTRGKLTAEELRQKEAGRFLRRRRAQQGRGPGGRGAVSSGRDGPGGSPYSGQTVKIDEPVSIKKLANALAVQQNEVLRAAMRELGFGININSLIDAESAILLAEGFDVELEVKQEVAAEAALILELDSKRDAVDDENLIRRAPTVAFLGHVDHGKTTLIDTIRKSRIANAESGGITQHIGAYQVTNEHGHTLTIIDTPGHEAFTAMRARGAQAVDIIVLVVAVDDGVKPQTTEAFAHAKAAGVPVVIALNKMDKPEANREKALNDLATLGITPEDWGGDTAVLGVSGLTGDGIEDLLERVFLETEILELQCHPKGAARGVVLEALIEKGKGKVAHLLIQDGTLERGEVILAGEGYGKVRAIHDDRGGQIKEAGPSTPVEVTGLNELPMAGDNFYVVESLDRAQEVAGERARKNRQIAQVERVKVDTENVLEAVAEAAKASVNLIIKTDVQGSAEVLRIQLADMVHDEVSVKLVHVGVGDVLESDVDLAKTSDATILAFHSSFQSKVRQAADRANVTVRSYEVIYELLDDVRKLMEGELAPEFEERITGHIEVRVIFKSSRFGNIAGSYVLDGKIRRSHKARLKRGDTVVYEGGIDSLRREKDTAKEVREGFECGVLLKDFDAFEEGDVIEAYEMVEIKRTI